MEKLSKKQKILNNYWDSKSKGMSRKEKEELDNWMVEKYGREWIRKTKPSLKKRIKFWWSLQLKKWRARFPKKQKEEKKKYQNGGVVLTSPNGNKHTVTVNNGTLLPAPLTKPKKKGLTEKQKKAIMIAAAIAVGFVAWSIIMKRRR